MTVCKHAFHNGVTAYMLQIGESTLYKIFVLWVVLWKKYFHTWTSNQMMDFYLLACLLEVLIKLDIASKTLKEYLGWLKVHFSAGLQSFYKHCSKKNGLYLGVHTNWMLWIYPWVWHYKQPGYYDFSTLTFSDYIKYTYWETFG